MDDAISYLFGLEQLGIKFGLENIRALAAELGNPQDAWPSAIVAGTNGKGSVAAMVETGLRAAGIRTGLYTSPHLVRLEERFAIDGRPVATRELETAASTVRAAIGRLRTDGRLLTDPTFFEATTAAAFELFRRAGAGFVVLEVGLGGRLDATNAAAPIAAALTTIDRDHEIFLGRTIAAIAAEKAGVIKPGMRVVVGETKDEAVQVIARTCRERGAVMVAAHEGVDARVEGFDEGAPWLDLTTPTRRYGRLRMALRGRHQVRNAVVAVRLLEEISNAGFAVPDHAIRAAVVDTCWPGRLDMRRDACGRQVLCDAAHNPEGARALAAYLREFHPNGLPLVFGIMRDKDVANTLLPVLPSATHLILTQAHTSRALAPDQLAEVARHARGRVPVDIEADPRDALERGWTHAPTICAAGSVFLVGEVLAALAAGRGSSSQARS